MMQTIFSLTQPSEGHFYLEPEPPRNCKLISVLEEAALRETKKNKKKDENKRIKNKWKKKYCGFQHKAVALSAIQHPKANPGGQ